jgi:hypothetical protein
MHAAIDVLILIGILLRSEIRPPVCAVAEPTKKSRALEFAKQALAYVPR